MNDENMSPAIINNEFDYSNILPTLEAVSYLVQYCDQMNKQLNKLIEEDEEQNKRFKQEYKEYQYKHVYGQKLEVYIREQTYNNITCSDYDTFMAVVKDGNLNNVSSLQIDLCLDYDSGKGNELTRHENSFTIIFKPYEIKFARKSNFNDSNMNQIEDQINAILKQFPVANCIFCDKGKE